MRALSTPLLLLPALLGAAPRVQAPDAPWLTFTTAHYRIHCPKAFESFGREVAGRVEGVHAQYLGHIGYVHPKPIDIVILDPVMEANGMAFPLPARPHVVLWKTEPEADSAIGHHRGWAELLVVHELAHMHHLLRPARKAGLWSRLTDALGPLPRKLPRWVTEGYATHLEGKLTGSGRPHSAVRAAILRQWALEGKLPSYEALSGMGGFLGGSMAYLGGSAYLEWLEGRAQDPKALQTLWLRLAGRRDFDEAFLATFGFDPKDGYQRFTAELTHTALDLERRARAEGLREGEVVTQLQGWASDLALSPDGARLMARVLDPKRPGLYVWDLAKPAAKPTRKADPDEPEDLPRQVPVLPPSHRLGRQDGAVPWRPRWTSPTTLAFALRLPDQEGVLQPAPRSWTLGQGTRPLPALPGPAPAGAYTWREVDGVWNLVDAEGRVRTRTLAAAWNPVASPDGKWVYYTQLAASGLQIRRLDATLPPPDPKPLPRDPGMLVKDLVLPKADEPSPLPTPVAVEPHAYRVAESHDTFLVTGYGLSPAGESIQIGAGGNDMLGRLNWQALAGLGDGAGPRGALVGAAWRGWAWAPSVQFFSLLERPSAQRIVPVAGFDQERRGVELAVTREGLGRPRFGLIPFAATERVALGSARPLSRTLFGATFSLGQSWGRDAVGLQVALGGRLQEGRTDGQRWSLARLGLTTGLATPAGTLTILAEGGRVGGAPTGLDRFHLGGLPTSLRPASLDANRLVQAALPAHLAQGDRMARLRADLGGGGLTAYLEHSAAWEGGAPRPAAQRIAGAEFSTRGLGLPMDVVRRLVGNLTLTAGVHRPLDGPMKGRTVGTLSVIVRP